MQTEINFRLMDPRKIIAELERLNLISTLNIKSLQEEIPSFNYPHIKHYLESIIYASKPETATATLLHHLVEDVFHQEGFSEVKTLSGFADYIVQEKKEAPILIELKPGFFRMEDNEGRPSGIKAAKLKYEEHQVQVQKYLTQNDYIILTNLRESYLFNRDSLIKYQPFYEISFTELQYMFLENDCLWDNVRMLEDQYVKPELETPFFQDLSKWFEEFKNVKFKENDSLSKNELIVLLINKVIFIKTLEDYGLIPYKFLDDEYNSKVEKWQYKSNLKLFDNFFGELEEWFYEYYDTELFKLKIWDFIDKDDENILTFRSVFERVLGLGIWESTFGKGLIHYNYRKIDEDVFGKAYETFIAKQRKDSGIFYTHRMITQYMSEKLVKCLFEPVVLEITRNLEQHDYQGAWQHMERLYRITIADTASGSGSFLIKVFREIYKYYEMIYSKLEYAREIHGMFEVPEYIKEAQDFIKKTFLDNRRKLMSSIILRHIHAIDIDERALETAKTNLWKEMIKVEKSLYRYKSLNQNSNHILPNLGFNFHCADSLYDLPVQVQLDEISKSFKEEIRSLHKLRWDYLEKPTNPAYIEKIFDFTYPIVHRLKEVDKSIKNPSLICLKFFYLFFDEDGNILPTENQGFSGIIGNPPWEAIKPVKKEFAHKSKFNFDVLEFEKWFNHKLEEDKDFSEAWGNYTHFYEEYSDYLKENYSYQDAGDFNYFKLFIERDLQLIKKDGFLNLLVPSGIQTDKGCSELRKLIIEENILSELYSFENRGFYEKEGDRNKTKIFPDVDNRFKFSVILCQKSKPGQNYAFKTKFYLHDPSSLYTEDFIEIDKEMIERFSPVNLSIMEFKTARDYELCCKIRNGKLLFEEHGYKFRAEFHMTNDSHLFFPEGKKPQVPIALYEGKMVHQFNSSYSLPKFWLQEEQAKAELLEKEYFRIRQETSLDNKKIPGIFSEKGYLLDFQSYRLAYRTVGSSTNERTLISSILPKNVFVGHSMNFLVNFFYDIKGEDTFIQRKVGDEDPVYLMALMNSMTLNYYIRNKISANLTMNFIYELPVPDISVKQKQQIAGLAFQILYSKSEKGLFEELGKELAIIPEENIDEIHLRAELEVMIAKELYGLTKEDWAYLTSTFIYGDESDSKKELDEIISVSKEIF